MKTRITRIYELGLIFLVGLFAFGHFASAHRGTVMFTQNDEQVKSITCGQIFSFEVAAHDKVWLEQYKDGELKYDKIYSVPLKDYRSVCGRDEGFYQNTVYHLTDDGKKSDELIGSTIFRINKAGTSTSSNFAAGAPFRLLTPEQGDKWIKGKSYVIKWQAPAGNDVWIRISCENYGFGPFVVPMNSDNGVYTFSVPNLANQSQCRAFVLAPGVAPNAVQKQVNGDYSGYFGFVEESAAPGFILTTSSGTDILMAGKDSWTVTMLRGHSYSRLSVQVKKNGVDLGEISLCKSGGDNTSCTASQKVGEEDVGDWVETVLIDGKKVGEIKLKVVPAIVINPVPKGEYAPAYYYGGLYRLNPQGDSVACGTPLTFKVDNYPKSQIWLIQTKNTLPIYNNILDVPDQYTPLCGHDEGSYFNQVFKVSGGQKGEKIGLVSLEVKARGAPVLKENPSRVTVGGPTSTSIGLNEVGKIKNRDVIKLENDDTLWRVKINNDQKFRGPIFSSRLLRLNKDLKKRRIKLVSSEILEQFIVSYLIGNSKTQDLYLIDQIVPGASAVKHLIPDEDVFKAHDFNHDAVFFVPSAELDLYTDGEDLTSPDQPEDGEPPEENPEENGNGSFKDDNLKPASLGTILLKVWRFIDIRVPQY